jgi:hypothetical protein
VPEREGHIREYLIKPGHIIQDNNLLACSKDHQLAVFEMLQSQSQIDFAGGLDAQLLKQWHIDEFKKLKVKHFWFSCDYPEHLKYFDKVRDLMADFKYWQKRCYVMIGFNGELIYQAKKRLESIYEMGFLPFAMLHQDKGHKKQPWTPEWDALQRKWCRPAAYNKRRFK